MTNIKRCPCCNAEAKHWFCTPDGKHITDVQGKMLWGVSATMQMIQCTKCGLRTKVYATAKGVFNSWNRRDYKEEVQECQKTEKNI